MKTIDVKIPCGDITLEGVLREPEGSGPFPAVIVCHPHPLHGGDMFNNVVMAIYEPLPRHGIAALIFNFRGVGLSSGQFGGGIAEQEDVKAAMTFLFSRPEIDGKQIGLAGYSFGGGVAAAVAMKDERVTRLALISPALSAANWEQLQAYPKPKLVMLGDSDQYFPVENSPQIKELIVVPGADHFWTGYEGEIAVKVTEFFEAGFKIG